MYCCHGLQNDIANAGQRGISILLFRIPHTDDLRFVLQSRGVAFDDEPKLGPIPTSLPYLINISCCGIIKYCPTCGRCLKELVEPSKDEFLRLAEEHKKYLPKDFYKT